MDINPSSKKRVKRFCLVIIPLSILTTAIILISSRFGFGALRVLGLLIPAQALVVGIWSATSSTTVSVNDIQSFIKRSEPNEWVYDDIEGIYTYEKNVNLRLEDEDYFDRRDFNESWVTNYPNSAAYRRLIFIYYGSSLIDKEYIVQVDEHRMFIPLPDSQSHTITTFQHHFGKVINRCKHRGTRMSDSEIDDQYNRYLERGDISINGTD